jgi:hypothetical protein
MKKSINKRDIIGKQLRHALALERADAAIDPTNKTAQLSFLSDAPIEHWFGRLILDMAPGSVRLERFRAGAPLLLCHDRKAQIGVIENPRVENGKLRGDTRFSRSALAQEIFQDVEDEIRKTTSAGFIVHDLVLEKSDDTGDTYRAIDWEPFEGSLEPIAADISVGVGRSLDDTEQGITREATKESRRPRDG